MTSRVGLCLMLAALVSVPPMAATDVTIVIDTPMKPPGWALLEQELLRANIGAGLDGFPGREHSHGG